MSITAAVRAGRDRDTPPKASTALVPIIAATKHAPVARSLARHDAFFVAQLIAMAHYSPQTRALRRADPQVAHAAYSTTVQNENIAQATPRVLRIA